MRLTLRNICTDPRPGLPVYHPAGEDLRYLYLQIHCQHAEVEEVSALSDTSRGTGGFGSTGMRKPEEKKS